MNIRHAEFADLITALDRHAPSQGVTLHPTYAACVRDKAVIELLVGADQFDAIAGELVRRGCVTRREYLFEASPPRCGHCGASHPHPCHDAGGGVTGKGWCEVCGDFCTVETGAIS
jgi:hypothetical protein